MFISGVNILSQQILIRAVPTMDKAVDLFGWMMYSVLVQNRGCWTVKHYLLVSITVDIMKMLE